MARPTRSTSAALAAAVLAAVLMAGCGQPAAQRPPGPPAAPAPAAPAVPQPAAPAGLAVGSYRPSAATTGVPAGTVLKPFNSAGADLVITQDGTVLDGLEIYGDIKVRAKNGTIRNSRLHGGPGIPASSIPPTPAS